MHHLIGKASSNFQFFLLCLAPPIQQFHAWSEIACFETLHRAFLQINGATRHLGIPTIIKKDLFVQLSLLVERALNDIKGTDPFWGHDFLFIWTDSNEICTAYVKLNSKHILFMRFFYFRFSFWENYDFHVFEGYLKKIERK